MVLLSRFADSQSLDLRPIQTFQNVSLGNLVNRGQRTPSHSARSADRGSSTTYRQASQASPRVLPGSPLRCCTRTLLAGRALAFASRFSRKLLFFRVEPRGFETLTSALARRRSGVRLHS